MTETMKAEERVRDGFILWMIGEHSLKCWEIVSWRAAMLSYKMSKHLLPLKNSLLRSVENWYNQVQHFLCLFKVIRCERVCRCSGMQNIDVTICF